MPNIDQLLINETGRIMGDEINKRTIHTSPWIDLVPQDTWPDEVGSSFSVMTYERTLPASSPTWTTVTYNDGTGNNCVTSAEEVAFAQTLRTTSLAEAALESPPICVNDLRFSLARRAQLDACFSMLGQNATYLMSTRARSEYCRLATHQVIADASLTESTTMPSSLPTSRMTSGILKTLGMRLRRDGAARDGGSFGMERGQPQFVVVMSPEMDDLIVTEDYQIREDFRNSDRVPELLQPMGVDRAYRGFYHLIDEFPRRWEWSGSAWTEVLPYTGTAATQGTKYEINSSYTTATYEDVIIFVPTVYTQLNPKPITSPGGNTSFADMRYGKWRWNNIHDRVENPDQNWGYFRGVFSNGSQPKYPQFGYVVRCLRADAPLNLVDANGNTPA